MTQNEKLTRHFRDGGSLTASQARKLFGVQNLRARVDELRGGGWCIFTGRTSAGKARYSLGRPTRDMVSSLYETVGGSAFRDNR